MSCVIAGCSGLVKSAGTTTAGSGGTATPSITALSPTSGAVGTSVTITGANFGTSQGTVQFNGATATATSWSAASIVVPVPSSATTGNVIVTAGGVASNGMNFTVNSAAPSISSLSPTSGAVGSSVTISGANFGATQSTSTVKFNGVTATATSWSATSIVATVPTGATTGSVVVAVGGVASNGVSFTVNTTVSPSISSLSPTSGVVGTSITIAGANFGSTQGTSTVKFNGVTATPTSWNATSIVAAVPTGATTGSVVVTVGGVASNGVPFTVSTPAPSVSGLSPTSGAVGTSVTITGTNFGSSQGTSTVHFNGTAATPTSWSATSIVAPVPTGATTGNVVVTVGGVASNGVSFAVSTPAPSISGLSPTSGAVGSSVTISGANFGAAQSTSTVKFNGVTATATSWSATSIVASVPTGATTGSVVVAVGGVASNGVSFTVNTTVSPSVSSLSPTSGVVGTSITIAGANFGSTQGTSTVKFNGTTATPTSWSASRIVATVPTGATTGSVVVTVGGVASNSVSFTVSASATPPTVPTGLTATAVSSSQINLSWSASTDSSGTLAGYKVYRNGTQVGTSTTTSYQDTGLAASTTYTYNVAAYDTTGNTSAQSSAAAATTQASSGSGGCGSGATALAQLACSMSPGTWAPLNTNNFNNGDELRPPNGGSGLEFTERAAWNPINNTVMILGGSHPASQTACGSTYLAAYTESTNTWANNLPSPCSNFDNSEGLSAGIPNLVHPYDQSAAMDANGNLYHRQYDTGKVMVFSQSSQSWSQCTPYNTSGDATNSWVDFAEYQAAGSLVYFPDRNSLIYLDGDWGLWELPLAGGSCTGKWTLWASTNGGGFSPQLSGLGSYQNVGQYSSLCHCVIIGGNSTQMFKIDASFKITQLSTTPIFLGIPQNPGSPIGAIYTVDPVGGHFLAWSGNGSDNGTAYDYNPTTDSWTTTGIKSPIFPGPEGGVTETVAIPIPKYGVIMFVQAGSASGGAVYLYKHTTGSSTPPTVSVTVNPSTVSLQTNATQQFTATVTGTSNTAVTWTTTGGTVTSGGLYTAPNSAGTFTVTATSVADTTKTASATVTVTSSGGGTVSVTISPTSANMQISATQQFSATVTGSSDTAVTWTATGGTISTTGLYTAPNSTGTFTVTATSVADSSKSATAALTISSQTSGAINGWTNRIAGINVPGGTSSIVSDQSFDAASAIPTCNGPTFPCSTYSNGAQFYTTSYQTGTPAQDCAVAADGPCSIKFTVANGSFQGDSGFYDYNFNSNLTAVYGNGQEFFIQYKERLDPAILGTFSGAGGLKHDITTEGDTNSVQAGDCSNSPGEIVTIQDMATNGPWIYVNCGYSTGSNYFTNVGYEPLQLGGAPGSNFLDQNASGCPHYAGQGGIPLSDPTCFRYVGNEWFTVQIHVKVGAFGSPNSVIEQWFAHAGSPSVLVSNASDAAIPNDGSGGASGKYGKIQLSTYDTGATFNVSTAAWFDDLIVSTRRIPDPDIANPNAPDSLSLSNIAASSVTVNWRVNSQNGTAQDDTGFLVERCAGTGATCFPNPQSGFTQIGTTAAGASSYVDNTVVAGTTYTYRVRAKNASGNSAYAIAQCFNNGGTCGGTVTVP